MSRPRNSAAKPSRPGPATRCPDWTGFEGIIRLNLTQIPLQARLEVMRRRVRGRGPDWHTHDRGMRPLALTAPRTLEGTYSSGYIQRMDAVLHALADGSRRTVLEALGQGDATVGELAALLPIARPGVSRHLRVLREAGLVEVRQEAQWRVYSLRPEPLAEIDDWLGRYRSLWQQRLDALHTEVARGKKQRRSTK